MTNSSLRPRSCFAGCLAAATLLVLAPGCGVSVPTGGGSASVAVTLAADYGEGADDELSPAGTAECPLFALATDNPFLQPGLDCDADGGVVRFITPSSYKVAVKRLSFENADGTLVDVIPDSGTLAGAFVADLTAPVTLPVASLPVGSYTGYYVELYYHEITMPLYDAGDPQTLRVYVSDDDFAAEGNLGHHQGDITLLDGGGNELGFVPAGEPWLAEALLPARGEITGAGGTDPETGHLRGLYGDADHWNKPESMQGAGQDVFIFAGNVAFALAGGGGAATFVFNVQDTWFFEDFDGNSLFNPCENDTLDGCGGEWTPVFNPPIVTVE